MQANKCVCMRVFFIYNFSLVTQIDFHTANKLHIYIFLLFKKNQSNNN